MDDIKLAGKKHNIDPMWKFATKKSIWENQHPSWITYPQNLRISLWSHDMAGHAKKCVERYCELANKTTHQLYKVSTPCVDDHHFKEEEETKSVGELSNTSR